MNEEDLVQFLEHPCTMVASDGGPRVLGEDLPHPRSYGSNARVLGRYVREQGRLSLEEAIRRMNFPARGHLRPERAGPPCRGRLRRSRRVRSRDRHGPATFEDPHRYAEGFSKVIVNGRPVIREGQLTGERSGRPVRRGR